MTNKALGLDVPPERRGMCGIRSRSTSTRHARETARRPPVCRRRPLHGGRRLPRLALGWAWSSAPSNSGRCSRAITPASSTVRQRSAPPNWTTPSWPTTRCREQADPGRKRYATRPPVAPSRTFWHGAAAFSRAGARLAADVQWDQGRHHDPGKQTSTAALTRHRHCAFSTVRPTPTASPISTRAKRFLSSSATAQAVVMTAMVVCSRARWASTFPATRPWCRRTCLVLARSNQRTTSTSRHRRTARNSPSSDRGSHSSPCAAAKACSSIR